jgi:hypothetical protein
VTAANEATRSFPLTRLALRVWQFDRAAMAVRSLNSPARKAPWTAKAMASPTGAWPHDRPLTATCSAPRRKPKDGDAVEDHGPVPGRECSCGIYATTKLEIINTYLSRNATVLGVVELGGRVIPATQGYRAAYARLAAVLLIDEALTEPHRLLRQLAEAYRVPAVVPHSADPEDYRELIGAPSLAAEAEEYLRKMGRP